HHRLLTPFPTRRSSDLARGGNRIGCLHEAGNDRLGFDVAVVGGNRVDDGLALLVLSCNVHADLDMRALDFMVERFADVVQKTGPDRKSTRLNSSHVSIS